MTGAVPWPWGHLARWVSPDKSDTTYEPGQYAPALTAMADRIEVEGLLPALVDRFLPGLDATTLRALAADPRVCATLELHEAMHALHRAADTIASPFPDLSAPLERLDLDKAGAWLERLLPLIPPRADIPNLRPHEDADRLRGKAPGLPLHYDQPGTPWRKLSNWRGDWAPTLAGRDYALRIAVELGGNMGLRLGTGADGQNLLGLDLDTAANITPHLLELARRFVRERTGSDAPVRFGREGRALLLIRCDEALRKGQLSFESGDKVELLGHGQQCAIDGTHPSGAPYRTAPLLHDVKPADVPLLTASEVAELMDGLAARAQILGLTLKERTAAKGNAQDATDVPDRAALVGDLDEVRELVSQINSPDDRNAWIKFLAALKGATLDHPDEGLEMARDRSWHDSPDEVAETERVWHSINPPRLGIRELRVFAGLQPDRAQDVFAVVPGAAVAPAGAVSPAGQQAQQRAAHGADYLDKIDPAGIVRDAAAGFDENPPPLDAIVMPLAIRGSLTMLSGDGGTGKSMFALGLAYEIASGVPFLSHGPLQVKQRGRVLFLTAEENASDMARRRSLWRKRAAQMSTDGTDYVAQLRTELGNVYVVPTTEATVTLYQSARGATEALDALESLCKRIGGLDVLIVDPAGSFARMDATKELGDFVMVLRALAARLNIAVILLHHISKGAANTLRAEGGELDQHASLGSVMGVNSARVGANLQRMPEKSAAEWGIAGEDAHKFVGLNVPKANSMAPIITPLWFCNEGGVLMPANLAHREKADVKREATEKERHTKNQRMARELLQWAERDYKAKEPPSKSRLDEVLMHRAACNEKSVRAFTASQISSGVLILDESFKINGRSKGAIRPGNLDPLRQEIAPQAPADPARLFDSAEKSTRAGRYPVNPVESGECGVTG